MAQLPAVLITGASTGIGATYADRFAKRGHDLVLVARNTGRLNDVANEIREKTGVGVDVVTADLTDSTDLAAVEDTLRDDHRIGILVNNAGVSAPGDFVGQDPQRVAGLIALNVVAPTRLAAVAAARFAQQDKGAIVTIGSVVGLSPEYGQTVYGASKAFVLFLCQGLGHELQDTGVYVQAVLPAATRTEIWELNGRDLDSIPGLMDVGEMVDAALVGFDRREAVNLPSLPDVALWQAHEQTRLDLIATVIQSRAAARYLPSA